MRFFALSAVVVLASAPAFAQDEPPQPQPVLPHVKLEGNAAPTVSFAAAISTSLARNPNAIVAYDEIRRAEALVVEVRSASIPTLYAGGTFTQLNAPRLFGSTVDLPQTSFQANGTLTVPLVVPKPWALWSQSRDQVTVARMTAEDTRRVVATAVARAFLTIIAQKRVIDAVVRARDTDRAHYEYAHQRFVGGIGNRIDEVRANQQLQTDEATVQQQYVNLTRDREALGVLVGVGGALDAEDVTLPTLQDEKQAMTDAEHRSDVQVGNARVHQAQHTVNDSWTDYSPYLSGVFMPFYQNPPEIAYPQTGWQLELLLTIPLYDGGLRYGQQRERRVNRDEAQAQLDATLRQARSDVRTAFDEVRRADAALLSSRDAAKLAEEALELANLAYRAGAFTNIEVIDAERTARDAETAVAVAEDNARQARVDLLSATGHLP